MGGSAIEDENIWNTIEIDKYVMTMPAFRKSLATTALCLAALGANS